MKILWRLSILPWLPVALIMVLVIMPIRWLLVGKWLLGSNDFRWFKNWMEKIGL